MAGALPLPLPPLLVDAARAVGRFEEAPRFPADLVLGGMIAEGKRGLVSEARRGDKG